MKLEEKKLVLYLKINKIDLNRNYDAKISEYTKKKITSKSILSLYQIASIYELSSLAKQTFKSIERCFTTLAETSDFLESDYTAVANILYSQIQIYGPSCHVCKLLCNVALVYLRYVFNSLYSGVFRIA